MAPGHSDKDSHRHGRSGKQRATGEATGEPSRHTARAILRETQREEVPDNEPADRLQRPLPDVPKPEQRRQVAIELPQKPDKTPTPPKARPRVKQKRFSNIASAARKARRNKIRRSIADSRVLFGDLDSTRQLPAATVEGDSLSNQSITPKAVEAGLSRGGKDTKHDNKKRDKQANDKKKWSPDSDSPQSGYSSLDHNTLDESIRDILVEQQNEIKELDTLMTHQESEIKHLEANCKELQSIIDDINGALSAEMEHDPVMAEDLGDGVSSSDDHPLNRLGPAGRLVRRIRQMPGFTDGHQHLDAERAVERRTFRYRGIRAGDEDDAYDSDFVWHDFSDGGDEDDEDDSEEEEEDEGNKNMKKNSNNRQTMLSRFTTSILGSFAMGQPTKVQRPASPKRNERKNKDKNIHHYRPKENSDRGVSTKIIVSKSHLKKKLKKIQDQVEDAHVANMTAILADREALVHLVQIVTEERDMAYTVRDEAQQQNERMRTLLKSVKDCAVLDSDQGQDDRNNDADTISSWEQGTPTMPSPTKESDGPRPGSGSSDTSLIRAPTVQAETETEEMEAPGPDAEDALEAAFKEQGSATPVGLTYLASLFNGGPASDSSTRKKQPRRSPQMQQVAAAIDALLSEPGRPPHPPTKASSRFDWDGLFDSLARQVWQETDVHPSFLLGAQDVLVTVWALVWRQRDNLAMVFLYSFVAFLAPVWKAVEQHVQSRLSQRRPATSQSPEASPTKLVQRIIGSWQTYLDCLVLHMFPGGTKHLKRYFKPKPPFPRDAMAELIVSAFVLFSGFAMYCAIQERSIWLDNNADFPMSYLQTYILQRRQDIDGSINVSSSLFSASPSSLISQSQSRRNPFTMCVCLPTLVDPRFITMPLGVFWAYCSNLLFRFGWFLDIVR